MNTLDRIQMAIDRINTKGWTQHSMETSQGGGCLLRSIITDGEYQNLRTLPADPLSLLLDGFDNVRTRLYQKWGVEDVVKMLGFKDRTELIQWNDDPGFTEAYIERQPVSAAYVGGEEQSALLASLGVRWRRHGGRTKAEVLARLNETRDRLLEQAAQAAVAAMKKDAVQAVELVEA